MRFSATGRYPSGVKRPATSCCVWPVSSRTSSTRAKSTAGASTAKWKSAEPLSWIATTRPMGTPFGKRLPIPDVTTMSPGATWAQSRVLLPGRLHLQRLDLEAGGLRPEHHVLGPRRLPVDVGRPDGEGPALDLPEEALDGSDEERDDIGRPPRSAAPGLHGEEQQAHQEHRKKKPVPAKSHRNTLGNSEGGFAPLPKPPPRIRCAGKAGARTASIRAHEIFSARLLGKDARRRPGPEPILKPVALPS